MASDPIATTEHVVSLNGLAADTTYFYAIGTDVAVLEGDDADHLFRTAPVTGPARPFRIWVTGDGGFANANGAAVRDAYAAFAGDVRTDLWLLLGDNAYLLGTDADYQAALFDMHHDLLLRTPTISTFGSGCARARWASRSLRSLPRRASSTLSSDGVALPSTHTAPARCARRIAPSRAW